MSTTFSLSSIFRVLLTLTVLAIALFFGHMLWEDYMYSPWTRDGRVRADIVQIAADVPGLVAQVHVRDNQPVRKGDPLFTIDPTRFRDALARADADVAQAQAQRGLASAQSSQRASESRMRRAQAERRAMLARQQVVSAETQADFAAQAEQALRGFDAARSGVQASEAAYQAALAAREVARLDLARSVVRAPADGVVTNLNLRAGDYAIAGSPRLAIINAGSFWVYGYFEETKLPRIHIGARARIRLVSGGPELSGRVESIAGGIVDRDNPTGDSLLHNVNPVFTWVRLAQRIPVRVMLDPLPDGVRLVSGMTCSIVLTSPPEDKGDRP